MGSMFGCRSLLLSAGTGAIVALAGVYLARNVRRYFRTKPKKRLIHNNLLLSSRCAWFLSELDAEGDLQLTPASVLDYSCDYLISEQETLPYLERCGFNRRLVRQEADYQVIEYNACTSIDQGLTFSLHEHDAISDCVSQDGLAPPSISAWIVNDEFTLIEGAAICMQLADLYGQFVPKAEHKAEYYSWIVHSASTFDSIVKTLHLQMVEMPVEERNCHVLDSALSGFDAFARALTETLTNNAYLCGNNFTAADCVVGFTLWWASTINHGQLLDSYPMLRAYLDKLRARPAFQKTFEQQDHRWNCGQFFMTHLAEE